MIDPLLEDLISPKEAARIFPRGPRGKHPHVSLVYRAMKSGCRNVVLESVRAPRLATSREAVARFIARLTEQAVRATPPIRNAAARERHVEQVERGLDLLRI